MKAGGKIKSKLNNMTKKIKILIITHTFPTKYNPVAAIFLLNQLVELKKYFSIRVIFPYPYIPKFGVFAPYHKFSDMPKLENIKGIEIYHPKYFMFPRIFGSMFLNFFLFTESFFSYLNSRKLADKIMKNWNPDIIHMHGAVTEGLIGAYLKKKYKKPLLVTVYGEDVTKFAKQVPTNYLAKLTLNNSDLIICQSNFLNEEIKGMGILNKRFFRIPMGANTGRFKPRDKYKSRKKLNLPKDKKIILFVGHLVTRKGVEYLIKAIEIIVKKDSGVVFCIIGKGQLEKKLKALTHELGLTNYIKFLGQKNHEDIVPYINACDLFVLPSLNEGLPVVLCEALSCGKPVVATSVAGTPELINKNVGYLVEPKNVEDLAKKILLALNKKWDKEKILQRAKNFSVKASARKLASVYKNAIVK